ncbi:VanZ family protein [Phycicoccus sp. BSK3Z-2]|uniref:VanZ family protein n=1 Tax=Phycicoccus avicenniae TaxID=2828860 RepID=A0A941D6C8_9MICO|nr:VanZ family protein [Phycicoccus avicenniae]MBR7742934.1 VanZ family protein [Phycicoccus avicenniae]
MSVPAPSRSRALLGAAAVALVVQGVVLYAPEGPGVSPFPHADKVVHVAVFAVPAVLLLLVGVHVRAVVLGLAGHAVLSEVLQGTLLPARSGDPLDAVADLVGVALGVGVAVALRRSERGPTRW